MRRIVGGRAKPVADFSTVRPWYDQDSSSTKKSRIIAPVRPVRTFGSRAADEERLYVVDLHRPPLVRLAVAGTAFPAIGCVSSRSSAVIAVPRLF